MEHVTRALLQHAKAEIDVLLDLPDITPRNQGSLRTGIDRVREVRYNLTAVDIDTDNWGPLMSRIIQRKFSKDLLGDFEEALENSSEMPTMDVIEKFLNVSTNSTPSVRSLTVLFSWQHKTKAHCSRKNIGAFIV